MTLNAEVQAYYERWAPISEYTKIRYDLVSTIAYAWVGLHYDKMTHTVTIKKYDNYNVEVDNLITYAHARGVKVVLTFMCDTDADKAFLADSVARTSAVNVLLAEVKTHKYDGVDNDIENSGIIKANMTKFHSLLADTFWASNSNYRVSLAISFSYGKVDALFDFSVLKNKVNYIFIMGYDYTWQDSPISGPVGPTLDDILYPGYGISVSLNHYIGEGIPASKLILGVPYYGFLWSTADSSRTSPTTGGGVYTSCKDMITSAGIYGRKWDSIWQTPWYVYQSGDIWYQGHYDDVQSLGIKYDLVKSRGIAGIGMWAIDFATDYSDFWNLIESKFVSFPTKFDVYIISDANNSSGILATKNTKGVYTADEACQLACDTLRNIN
jgi:spore germination protein YaaH